MPKFSRVQLIVSIFCLLVVGSAIWFGSFGDEQENIAAGWLMSQGLMPYTDFFFHHTPFPFVVSRLLFPFAINAYWLFRLMMLLIHLGTWIYLAKRFSQRMSWSVALTVVLVGLGIPTFLLQMFLADTLASLALVVLVSIWVIHFTQKTITAKELFWVSILAIFVSVWSSITTVLSIAVIVLTICSMLGWNEIKKFIGQVKWLNILAGVALLVSFPVLYAVTGHWKVFYWAVFEYNNKYYLPFRLTDIETSSHANFILTVFYDYLDFVSKTGGEVVTAIFNFFLTIKGSFLALVHHKSAEILGQHLSVALDSLHSTMARDESLGVVTLFALVVSYALFHRKWLVPLILLSITLRSRTNEIFHLSPFYVGLWFCLSVLLIWALQEKKKKLLVFCSALYITWFMYLSPGYVDHLKKRTPIILPEMQLQAADLRKHSTNSDTLLVLGGNVMYYPLTGLLPATPQIYYHPWFAVAPIMHDEVMSAVMEKKATVILLEDFEESYKPTHFAFDIAQRVRSEYQHVGTNIFIATDSAQKESN